MCKGNQGDGHWQGEATLRLLGPKASVTSSVPRAALITAALSVVVASGQCVLSTLRLVSLVITLG